MSTPAMGELSTRSITTLRVLDVVESMLIMTYGGCANHHPSTNQHDFKVLATHMTSAFKEEYAIDTNGFY